MKLESPLRKVYAEVIESGEESIKAYLPVEQG